LREGLIGGVTSLGWVLLDKATRRGELEYSGLKKVDGQKLHELKYLGRKAAGEFRISLYFDPETYRHVLSLYVLRVPALPAKYPGQGTSDQLEGYYRIREEFSSFKTVDDLTLPCAYKLSMTVEGQDRTFLADWTVAITQVQHNQPLEAGAFIVK